MIRKNKWKLIVTSIVILLPIVAGLLMWNILPQEMATHWSFNGSANGWRGKAFAVFAMPLTMLTGHWICILVTALDPKNKNQTRKAMNLLFWIFPFISVVSSAIGYSNALGVNFGIDALYPIVLGLMFIVIGNLLPKCKQNHTFGIRVKWALESDENWNATHRFGGKVWVIGGLILMLCALLPKAVLHYAVFAIIIVLAIIPSIYSYKYYRKQLKSGAIVATTPLSTPYKRIRMIVLSVVILGCAILIFTGDVRMQYDDTSFTIVASYYGDLTVDYASIEAIEYRDQNTPGTRTGGFGSPRLQMGNYHNDEYGFYTRYTYTMCKACVVLTVDGRTLVINGTNADRTEMIYSELLNRTGL